MGFQTLTHITLILKGGDTLFPQLVGYICVLITFLLMKRKRIIKFPHHSVAQNRRSWVQEPKHRLLCCANINTLVKEM